MAEASHPAPAPELSGRSAFRVRLGARDLINAGIFAAIYVVVVNVVGLVGFVSPLLLLLSVPVYIIAGGIPFMLFLTRVKHAGVVTVFAFLVGLVYLLMGSPAPIAFAGVALALLGELLLWVGRYRSKWAAILTYALYSLQYFGSLVPMLTDREAYLGSEYLQQMGAAYVEGLDQLLTGPVIWVVGGVMLVSGLLGGLLGAALLRKHFTRAGLA